MAVAWSLGCTAGAVEDAMRDTSVASSFQVNRAVVQNTCRRLCQVHSPLPAESRQLAARLARCRTLRLKLDDRQCLPRGAPVAGILWDLGPRGRFLHHGVPSLPVLSQVRGADDVSSEWLPR